jgi:hypothetical protein
MAIYRLLCTKSQIAAVSMGHWTVRIIMLVSTLLVGILIGLYYAGLKTSEVGIALSVCHKQSMQVLQNYSNVSGGGNCEAGVGL